MNTNTNENAKVNTLKMFEWKAWYDCVRFAGASHFGWYKYKSKTNANANTNTDANTNTHKKVLSEKLDMITCPSPAPHLLDDKKQIQKQIQLQMQKQTQMQIQIQIQIHINRLERKAWYDCVPFTGASPFG